jgi:hypothetical protein
MPMPMSTPCGGIGIGMGAVLGMPRESLCVCAVTTMSDWKEPRFRLGSSSASAGLERLTSRSSSFRLRL